LPYIGGRVVAAAGALDEQARVAFVEKVGAAFKTVVMSDTFAKAHADAIRQEHNAVDHGIIGLVSTEDLVKRKDLTAFEKRTEGESAVSLVDNMESQNAKTLQLLISQNLDSWTRNADDVKRKDRAKFQKMVRDAQALQALGTSDVQKLRRGVAVLYSMDRGGPDTEAALYALRDRAKAESEQLAWDQYNLKTVLRKQLTTFVALVPTVDFAAATKEEEGKVLFVNPAYEKKGQVWKACFRAGKPVSMRAMEMAQAWLKEL
jgi:microcompartment protein CcmK/EutM